MLKSQPWSSQAKSGNGKKYTYLGVLVGRSDVGAVGPSQYA